MNRSRICSFLSQPIALATMAAFALIFCPIDARAQVAGRLRYDSQCMTIDGKDTIIFSGAFHYFRCPKELWADRFAKLKAAGLNTVETYAAWNYHEQLPPTGVDDYSRLDMTDLHDWLEMATNQFGLNVILRPGPYICAEWDGGGYPQWLLTKRPKTFTGREWYRGDDPTYLAWCKHWYTAVAKVAAPYQLTHRPAGKGGIILWQIENEYNYWDQPAAVKAGQLSFLAHLSRNLGIDVPLTTCLTDNPLFRRDPFLRDNVIETRNTYPKYSMDAMWHDIGMLYVYQPEKFKMITELQGGWFSQVGGKISEAQGFNDAHINQVTLNAWEGGFTSTNYYMGFGGTNFGDWAARGLTSTYDYDAPLRECGGVTDRYFAVKALGEFIADHGAVLARSRQEDYEREKTTLANPHVEIRRGADGSRFVFVRNTDQHHPISGSIELHPKDDQTATIRLNYDLGNFGAKVLYLPAGKTTESDGVWYPKPQKLPARPTDLPAPIQVTEILQKADTGPTSWEPFDPALSEADAGIFNRQFVFYRATIPAGTTKAGSPIALTYDLDHSDWLGVQVNHHRLTTNGDKRLAVDAGAESAVVQVLYENAGRANFGSEIEEPSGMRNASLMLFNSPSKSITGWKEKHIDRSDTATAELSADYDDSSWTTADISVDAGDVLVGSAAVYRATVDLSATEAKALQTLVLKRVDDDGYLYVNGHPAGESHEWAKIQRFDVKSFLHAGKNTIAVRVINRDGTGGLSRGAELESSGKPIASSWQFSQKSQGVVGNWSSPNLDDSTWSKSPAGDSNELLTWYRLKFKLPKTPDNEWIPWRLNLQAVGNGFLCLNGHPLGRWWQVGPQHDYYMPECWLKFGPDAVNVVTIEMRPTDMGNGVVSATVRPYEKMAEFR